MVPLLRPKVELDRETPDEPEWPEENSPPPPRKRAFKGHASGAPVAAKRKANAPGKGNFTLEDLAAMLGRDANMNVVIDRHALEEASIRVDEPLEFYGRGRMSLRGYARFLLGNAGLALEEEPYRLLITTKEAGEQRLTTEVYPVGDLMLTDRVADRGLLADPYMDCEEAVRGRIREKLQRPIRVDFHAEPLHDVLDELAEILDDTVLVYKHSLDEASIDVAAPVTAALRNAPVGESLRWMLRDLGLTYVVRDEALDRHHARRSRAEA